MRHAEQYAQVHGLFFQAEDGIRDLTVTGVQTCALPISKAPSRIVWSRALAIESETTCSIVRMSDTPCVGMTARICSWTTFTTASGLHTVRTTRDRKSVV